jgi:hypothetical protein
MVAPIRPAKGWHDRPAVVADIEVNFADDYMPRDRYQVSIVLSRSLDAYELRVIELEPLAGFWAERDRLVTNQHIETIDAVVVESYLTRVTNLATDRRERAVEEKQRIRAEVQKLKSILRPNS